MPCNAKVVVTAKAKVVDISKLPNVTRLSNGNYKSVLNSTVYVEVDQNGNAFLRYTGNDWDEGVKMLSSAIIYLQKLKVELDDIGKPETHRHNEQEHYSKTGVTN